MNETEICCTAKVVSKGAVILCVALPKLLKQLRAFNVSSQVISAALLHTCFILTQQAGTSADCWGPDGLLWMPVAEETQCVMMRYASALGIA